MPSISRLLLPGSWPSEPRSLGTGLLNYVTNIYTGGRVSWHARNLAGANRNQTKQRAGRGSFVFRIYFILYIHFVRYSRQSRTNKDGGVVGTKVDSVIMAGINLWLAQTARETESTAQTPVLRIGTQNGSGSRETRKLSFSFCTRKMARLKNMENLS